MPARLRSAGGKILRVRMKKERLSPSDGVDILRVADGRNSSALQRYAGVMA